MSFEKMEETAMRIWESHTSKENPVSTITDEDELWDIITDTGSVYCIGCDDYLDSESDQEMHFEEVIENTVERCFVKFYCPYCGCFYNSCVTFF
jgi:hypothetical protein